MRLCFALVLVANAAWALPPWLSLGGGLRFGVGPSQFTGDAHPAPPPDPNNLFSLLGPQVTQERQPSLAGSAGIRLHAGWARILELQAELLAVQEGSKSVEDLGSGIKREVEYRRAGLEWPLLLRLGWPIELDRVSVTPYASGGYWSSRLWEARQMLGIQGGAPSKEVEWKGAPMEDWGWCYGFGVETLIKGQPYVRRVGLEARVREGKNDLDPKGSFEQKARSLNIILFLGY